MQIFWDTLRDNYTLETLLDLKAAYWGLDSDEYQEWKEYFESLSNRELQMEFREYFGGDYE